VTLEKARELLREDGLWFEKISDTLWIVYHLDDDGVAWEVARGPSWQRAFTEATGTTPF